MKSLLKIIYPLLFVFFLAGYPGPETGLAQDSREGSKEIHTIDQQVGKIRIRDEKWNMAQPVHIEADRMFSDQQDNLVVFTGKVAAVQGSLTINAEKMTVYHEPNSEGEDSRSASRQGQQIDRIVADGQVTIRSEDLSAAGEKVIFEIRDEKIFISGNARVWHQDNLVKGEKVVFDLTKGTTVFESGGRENKRVKAFFYPEKK